MQQYTVFKVKSGMKIEGYYTMYIFLTCSITFSYIPVIQKYFKFQVSCLSGEKYIQWRTLQQLLFHINSMLIQAVSGWAVTSKQITP